MKSQRSTYTIYSAMSTGVINTTIEGLKILQNRFQNFSYIFIPV
ncbi:hypothetical protein SAMN05661044_05333 [Olivibacter domesticus]|uniref:Uncharacterized protein n=1 Tax=Olivibacter domesticus TaxID=407022 RepID=A0A1H7YTX2_OLID1|nr:hypothetical protein SAMN05661044_05333 [Olivibacter domesticus]